MLTFKCLSIYNHATSHSEFVAGHEIDSLFCARSSGYVNAVKSQLRGPSIRQNYCISLGTIAVRGNPNTEAHPGTFLPTDPGSPDTATPRTCTVTTNKPRLLHTMVWPAAQNAAVKGKLVYTTCIRMSKGQMKTQISAKLSVG